MDVIDTKILVACLFGIARFSFGILPIKIYKCLQLKDGTAFVSDRRQQLIRCGLALFQSFSGGVIFATCFLHMIPEVYESTIQLKKYGMVNSRYPFSQLIVSIGFFLVYFVEEFAHYFISRVPDLEAECLKQHSINSARTVTPSNKVAPEIDCPTVIDEFPTPKKEPLENDDEERCGDERKSVNLQPIDDQTLEVEKVEELDVLLETKGITKQQIIRGILIVLALSLHAFFEGLAIGLQTSVGSIWYLFIAVSIHSATILFSIGLELMLAKARLKIIVIHVLILSLTSPLGVFLGLLITLRTDMNTKAKSMAVVFLEGLSAGTILYITFFEVLNREKERRVYRLRRAFFIILGFGLMACLECFEMKAMY